MGCSSSKNNNSNRNNNNNSHSNNINNGIDTNPPSNYHSLPKDNQDDTAIRVNPPIGIALVPIEFPSEADSPNPRPPRVVSNHRDQPLPNHVDPNPQQVFAVQQLAESKGNGWICQVCTFENSADAANCRMCGIKPPESNDSEDQIRIETVVKSQQQISEEAYRLAQEEERARPPPPKPLLAVIEPDERPEPGLNRLDGPALRARATGVRLVTSSQLAVEVGRLSPPRGSANSGRLSPPRSSGNAASVKSSAIVSNELHACIVCGDDCAWLRIADCTQPVCNSCVAQDVLAQADRGTGRFWCPLRCHVIPYNILLSLNKQGVLNDELWSRLAEMHSTAAIDDLAAQSGQKMLQCENCGEKIIVSAETVQTEPVSICHSIHCQGSSQICNRHGVTLRYAPSTGTPPPSSSVTQRPLSGSVRIGTPRQKVCVLCVQEKESAADSNSPNILSANALSEQELAANTRPCPKCGRRTFRDGGCRHMTCVCGHEYFWCCLRAYRDPEEARAHRRDDECEKYL